MLSCAQCGCAGKTAGYTPQGTPLCVRCAAAQLATAWRCVECAEDGVACECDLRQERCCACTHPGESHAACVAAQGGYAQMARDTPKVE